MALSYFHEMEAPREFKVSSTEIEGYLQKCLLCCVEKKNFYCPDCVKAGNFVHSSMPYAERYLDKHAKLVRLKVNRRHVLERCEKLLASRLKRDKLLTEAKQSRDKLDLLRLAIEQRRSNIEEKRKMLIQLRDYNNMLITKLPKYQKRVSDVGKLCQMQRLELENKVSIYSNQADSLAALRRSRIRQLTKYIFPVYLSYDTSESIEDMEFIGDDSEEEFPKRPQLHIVAPWINIEADLTHMQTWLREYSEGAGGAGAGVAGGAAGGAGRVPAALSLCAQLLALCSWALDVRLPHVISLSEYSNWRVSESGAAWRCGRLGACGAALCARAALPPAPPAPHSPPAPRATPAPRAPPAPHALCALHVLVMAANTDEPTLGRVEAWLSTCDVATQQAWADTIAALGDLDTEDTEPPEHINWPEAMEEEVSRTPPAASAGATSLVTSAAASLASMWRVFTK